MNTLYKIFLIAFFCITNSAPLFAQSPGDTCSTAGEYVARNISGTYTIMICDGSNYQEIIRSSDGKSNVNISYDSGSCTSAKTGQINYNSGANTWTYCNGTSWTNFPAKNGCTPDPTCPNIGDTCSGTGSGGGNPLFAGCLCYYDTNGTEGGTCKALYAAQGDQSTSSQWKTSTGSNDISTDSHEDGKINDGQIANSSTFPAFKVCKDLTDGGYTDWYLPANSELDLLYLNKSALGGFSTSYYWTSREYSTTQAFSLRSSNGETTRSATKTTSYYVRCVRRD